MHARDSSALLRPGWNYACRALRKRDACGVEEQPQERRARSRLRSEDGVVKFLDGGVNPYLGPQNSIQPQDVGCRPNRGDSGLAIFHSKEIHCLSIQPFSLKINSHMSRKWRW